MHTNNIRNINYTWKLKIKNTFQAVRSIKAIEKDVEQCENHYFHKTEKTEKSKCLSIYAPSSALRKYLIILHS